MRQTDEPARSMTPLVLARPRLDVPLPAVLSVCSGKTGIGCNPFCYSEELADLRDLRTFFRSDFRVLTVPRLFLVAFLSRLSVFLCRCSADCSDFSRRSTVAKTFCAAATVAIGGVEVGRVLRPPAFLVDLLDDVRTEALALGRRDPGRTFVVALLGRVVVAARLPELVLVPARRFVVDLFAICSSFAR